MKKLICLFIFVLTVVNVSWSQSTYNIKTTEDVLKIDI